MDQRGIEATVEGQCQEKDWINQLPNCLLEFIISLLTIKAAVHTSMVSRRWRHLWLDPILLKKRNLEFDIQNIFGSKLVGPEFKLQSPQLHWIGDFKTETYINRVNRFLQLYNGEKIDSFKVTFFLGRKSSRVLDEWIRFAIEKGVEELHLHLFPHSSDRYYLDYVFPSSLLSELNFSTLKCLSLRRCTLEPSLDFDKFSQLTNLHLYSVCIQDSFTEPLFSVCLFLESLTLKDCSFKSSRLIITGPNLGLKDLKLLRCGLYKVDIYAVNLASLEYTGCITAITSINAPQLTTIFVQPKFTDLSTYVLSQFALFSSVEILNLRVCWELPQFEVTFRNLKQLVLQIFVFVKDDRNLDCVMNLLKVAPVLEELTIMVSVQGSFKKEEKIENSGFTHNHLKEIKIQGFHGNSYEIAFLICILESTTKLERMTINSFGKVYMGDGIWDRIINETASTWTEKQRKEVTQLMLQKKLKYIKTNAQIVIH